MKKMLTAFIMLLAVTSLICAADLKITWEGLTDAGDKGSSKCTVTIADETIAGKACKGVITMKGQVTTKFKYGYIGMYAVPTDLQKTFVAALQAGKGIKFKTSGDGKKYDCRVETNDRKDYCYHLFTFTAPKNAIAEIEIPYSKLKQYSWGVQKPFKNDRITNASFQTIGQPIPSVELKIWDFEIMN